MHVSTLWSTVLELSGQQLICVYPSLFSVQQVRQCQGIGNIRGRDFYGVDDLLFTIHSDVGLHPEIPLFSLGRLMHLLIALPTFVLRRRGRADDRSVHDRATAHLDALLMPRRLTVRFTSPEAADGSMLHRIRNFAEDLQRAVIRDGIGQVENMDTAVTSVSLQADVRDGPLWVVQPALTSDAERPQRPAVRE